MNTQPNTAQDFFSSNTRPLAVIASSTCTDGYQLAKQFAENGYDLIIAAINPSVVEEAEELKELGVEAVSFQLDLSSSEGVEQLYRRIVATGRPVEAMVINTGLSQDFSQEKELAGKVLKDMAGRGQGQILFAGTGETKDVTLAYEALRDEAEGTGVTVTAMPYHSKHIQFLH